MTARPSVYTTSFMMGESFRRNCSIYSSTRRFNLVSYSLKTSGAWLDDTFNAGLGKFTIYRSVTSFGTDIDNITPKRLELLDFSPGSIQTIYNNSTHDSISALEVFFINPMGSYIERYFSRPRTIKTNTSSSNAFFFEYTGAQPLSVTVTFEGN